MISNFQLRSTRHLHALKLIEKLNACLLATAVAAAAHPLPNRPNARRAQEFVVRNFFWRESFSNMMTIARFVSLMQETSWRRKANAPNEGPNTEEQNKS
jgi:hypothetical protein